MPTFSDAPAPNRMKLLLLGEQGVGKTTQIARLANAGFQVRVLDLDNKLGIIHSYIKDKEAADRINYVTLPARAPESWEKVVKITTGEWPDAGPMKNWDDNTVFFVDTATFLADIALAYWKKKNGVNDKGTKFEQSIWGDYGDSFITWVSHVTSDLSKCHVVFAAHLRMIANDNGIKKLYPSFAGRSVPNQIGSYFNCIWMMQSTEKGPIIRTASNPLITLNNVAPGVIKAEEEADLGLLLTKIKKAGKFQTPGIPSA